MQTNLNTSKNKRKFQVPHTYITLFSFIVIMAILTYIIPAGLYDRIKGPEGRMMVDPNSYHVIPSTPVGLLKIFTAVPQGFVEAGWVVVLTFCIGGAITVVKRTGIIEIVVNNLAGKFANKGILIIPALMVVFATIDTFIGMPELCMIYIPIILPLIIALGFDSVTAAGVALLGSTAGFTSALTNPFTTGIGQKVAGIPLYSGTGYRLVVYFGMLIVGMAYLIKYAVKIKKNPELSLTYIEDKSIKEKLLNKSSNVHVKATLRQRLAGISTLVMFFFLIFGVLKFKWDMPEMGGMFIALGIVAGLIGGLNGKEICDAFTEGSTDVLVGALIVGIARGIAVVMNEGQIMDTIVHGLSLAVQGFPGSITSIGMMLVVTAFNFLVPSGSGKAVIMIPILAPLADVVGITRQTAILAYQFGDGISNIFWPTSGYFMASIALAGVPYGKWAKFMLPLFIIWTALGGTFLVIAQVIGF